MADQPLTIALIIATPGTSWGGMETHTLNLAATLAHRGHTLHVLAHEDYRERFDDELNFHPLPFQLSRRNPWLRFRLAKVLRSLSADIHHAQGNKAANLLGTLKKQPSDVVRIGTVHGVKSSHRDFSQMDGVISVSQTIQDHLEHRRTKLIYNGTAGHFNSRPSGALTSPFCGPGPHWVAVGRLEPVKGFERLIHAWSLARPKGQLTIIGDGSQRASLKMCIKAYGLEQDVTLAGYQHNIADWLRHANTCVISSDREAFPYVLIESLQAGCPVISTPVNGPLELLPPQSLAENFSPQALAEVMAAHAGQFEQLRELQAPACLRARTEFTAENMASSTEAFYQMLLAEKHERLPSS